MPRRGAAAHSRRRDARRADPRQALARRLARACRSEPVAVRQRRHLGPGADRPAGDDNQRAGSVGGADPPHRPQRRADHPRRRRRRHAAHGRAVRDRTHDRRGDRKQPRTRSARLHVLLRHAGRGGDHRRGRGALSRRIRTRRPRNRPSLASSRHLRRGRHLDQAFGAPPALSAHQARPRDEGIAAARERAGGARQILRHRLQHRRRGSRSARSVARHSWKRLPSTRISEVGTGSASSSKLTASAARRSSTG